MFAFLAALSIVGNFLHARFPHRGADRPVESIWRTVAGARGFRSTVRLFGCEYLGRGSYLGHSEELRNVLNAAGFDVYHLRDGIHVVDLTSASDKDFKTELPRFGKMWFGVRLTPNQRQQVGINI